MTILKVGVLVLSAVLALRASPDVSFDLPWSIETTIYAWVIGIMALIAFVEYQFARSESGTAGINFGASVALVIMFAGIGFLIILLGLNHLIGDNDLIDRPLSWYMGAGVFLLFIQGREEILHYKRIKQRIYSGG